MSRECEICAKILGLGLRLRLLSEFQFCGFVLRRSHLPCDERAPTSEERKKERKKERKTFNHQCSLLPTSRTLPFHPYLIPLRARVTRTKASPQVHPPLVLFSSLPFLGGKSRQKKRHEDAPTPSSSRRRRPRDVVREGSADDDDDRVARVSRHGAAFRAVREPGTACGTHLFFFASRFGCVSLSLFRAPSSPFVYRRPKSPSMKSRVGNSDDACVSSASATVVVVVVFEGAIRSFGMLFPRAQSQLFSNCVNSHYHHLSLYQKEAYGFAGAVLSAVLFLGHLSLIFFSSPDDDDSDDDALARVVRFATRCAVAAPLWGTFAVVFYVVAVECLSRARVLDVSDERLLSQKKSSTTQARRRQKRGDGGHGAGVFAAGECADVREWNEALFSPPRG